MLEVEQQIEIQTPQPIFERYAHTLISGPCHLVALAISALSDYTFKERDARHGYFNAGGHQALVTMLCTRVSEFKTQSPPHVFAQLTKQAYDVLLQLLQPGASTLIVLTGQLPVQFNEVRRLPKNLMSVMTMSKASILTLLMGQQLEPKSLQRALIIEKLALNDLVVDVIAANFQDIFKSVEQLFKNLNNLENDSLFRQNIVTKEVKPNDALTQTTTDLACTTMRTLVSLARSRHYIGMFTEDLILLFLKQLQHSNAQIYRQTVECVAKLLKTPARKLCLQSLLNDVQQVQLQIQGKLTYKSQTVSITRLCDLLRSSEPPAFLQQASYVLAALTECRNGDEALRESGVVRPVQLLLQVGGEQSILAACNIISGITEREQIVGENEAHRAAPEVANVGVCRDLVSCVPVITRIMNEYMWGIRVQKGETSDIELKQIQSWKNECVNARMQGQTQPDKPPKPTFPKVPMDPPIDFETAKLQSYKNVLSSLIRALADICACQEARWALAKEKSAFEALLFFSQTTNPCLLKWVCQVFANLALQADFKKLCNEYKQNSLYSDVESLETAVSLVFSLVGRLESQKIFNDYVTNLVLQSALEALTKMLDGKVYAEAVGLKMLKIFQILMMNVQKIKDKRTRAYLIGLAAQLAQVPHNAQIFLEFGVIDYLALLSLQMRGDNFLSESVCLCVHNLVVAAPVFRESSLKFINEQPSYYGEGNLAFMLGKNGVLENIIAALQRKQDPKTLLEIVKAIFALSTIAVNCVKLYRAGVVSTLLELFPQQNEDIQAAAAKCIKSIRTRLQALVKAMQDVKDGDTGEWGVL